MGRIEAAKISINVDTVFQDRLAQVAHDTEALLGRLLGPVPSAGERARPRRLLDAMRFSSLGGGKRLRPFLVVESAALFDVPGQNSLMAGAALECVHCYSLAHDDLLDLEGDPAKVGKATGKDAAAHKATLVGVLGPAAARRRLDSLVAEAQAALEPFGHHADVLKAAARFVATRSA
jgi:geranylgeranyl pyrophosphate synthase